jgi:tripartite ATP-independent transporter DctP family solute receptor
MKRRCLSSLVLVVLGLAPLAATHAQNARLRVGTIAPAGSPWIQSLELMKKNVEAGGPGGGIQFQIFPGGQLGDEVQLAEGTQFGTIECSGISAGALATLVPSFDVFELPYVWNSPEEAYYVIDNHFRAYFAQELQKHGLVLLGWSENGWRNFHTRNRAIRRPEDLRGLRMRSQESPIHLAFWRALGANAQPMAVTDVYQAFERGVIDGGENTIVLTMATGWAEVIKHVTISRHIYQPAVLVCNKKAYDRLTAAQRARVAEAMAVTEKDMRQRLAESEVETLALFRTDLKIQVVELNRGQIEEFRKRTQGVMNQPDIRKHLGAEVLQVLERGKQEFAKQIPVKKF